MNIFLVGLALVLVGVTAYLKFDHNLISAEIAKQESEKSRLVAENKQHEKVQLDLAYISNRQDMFNKLEKERHNYNKLLNDIAAVTPQKLQITSLTISLTKEIKLNGIASDRADIATFAERMSLIPELQVVTLNQTDIQTDGVHFSATTAIKGAAKKWKQK